MNEAMEEIEKAGAGVVRDVPLQSVEELALMEDSVDFDTIACQYRSPHRLLHGPQLLTVIPEKLTDGTRISMHTFPISQNLRSTHSRK